MKHECNNSINTLSGSLCDKLEEVLSENDIDHVDFLRKCYSFSDYGIEDPVLISKHLSGKKLSKIKKNKNLDICLFLKLYGFLYPNSETLYTSADKDASFSFHVELSSRIVTLPIDDGLGCDQAALTSVYSLFPKQREICHNFGRHCIRFQNLSNNFLNEHIRPFTTKWHTRLESPEYDKTEFRSELKEVQEKSNQFLAELKDIFMYSPANK